MSERWRAIEDAPGYEVSDLGRVRSIDRTITRRGRKTRLRGQVLATSACPYLRVRILGRTRLVHDLVLRVFVGPPPPGSEARHRNHDKADARLSNLRYGTRSENALDNVADYRHPAQLRTHCPREHLLRAPNLTAASARKGQRDCLACHRGRAAVRKAAKRGVTLDLREVSDQRYAVIMSKAAA